MSLKNSNIYTIDKYLKDKYYIPNYQRDYSWEEGELTDFWEDLERLSEDSNGEARHFFGQIVIHDDMHSKKKYIIDGQQRTITSTIFLRALQLAFKRIDNDYGIEKANRYNSNISSSYICGIDDYNLTLGESDGDYFRINIQDGSPENLSIDRVKSHERMRKAFQFFTDKLEMIVNGALTGQDRMDRLIRVFDTFTKRFEVLCMEATELSEAFIIFETLNARGKDLETADLLKNFIFSKSNDVNLAQSRWSEMLDSLDKADATKFIRHYWNSCHPFAREKELYKKISRESSSPRESRQLLEGLVKIAPYYHDLSYPTDGLSGFKSDRVRENIVTLKTFKASTYYPIVLAMLMSDSLNDEDQISKVLDAIILYVFRNTIICDKVANTAEVFFAKLAKDIYDNELTTTEDIVGAIKKEIVDDNEFISSFSVWSASSSTKDIARYILRSIHHYIDKYSELNTNSMEVHIEHIMPQDNSKWRVDEETHENYLWRLGNLALLNGPKNISISNDSFENKKEAYRASRVRPNEEICRYTSWGPEQIEERQYMLADFAKSIWEK